MTHLDPGVRLRLSKGNDITSLNYADAAERAIKSLLDQGGSFGRGRNQLTTTSLRGIYGLIMNVYTDIESAKDFEKHRPDLQYLKVRMAYEAGRKEPVKRFLEKTGLKDAIDSVKSYEQFLLYCRYAESLVAYFKFYGGKE